MDKQKKITQSEFMTIGEKFDVYIRESDIRLRTDENIIVHLDGVSFTHNYYKRFSSKTKQKVVYVLSVAAKRICIDMQSVRIAYVCSDEVSFVLDGKGIKTNDHNRLNKLVSKFASKLTLFFVQELNKLEDNEIDDLRANAVFSAKAYNLPTEKTEDYLKWRLLGCKKLIFDRRENFEKKADWEKYGYILTKKDNWNIDSLDFSASKIKCEPQNEYYQIKQ